MGFLPGVGSTEMLIVGIIALLLFGKNLPNVAKNMGKSLAELKKGLSGFQDEFRNVTREAERAVNYSPTPSTTPAKPAVQERPKVAPEATTTDEFTAPKFDLD
ncbi:MAG: twin-arginine translocase TatA/TatE family subunit [Planctomycetia bacterium]|jgi:sec-independent protein translocase protein TatA